MTASLLSIAPDELPPNVIDVVFNEECINIPANMEKHESVQVLDE